MNEEIDLLVAEMASDQISEQGKRSYHQGKLWDHPCVLAFSRWGKVAAAATATHLITRYGVSEIVFTGVAGGAAPNLRIGDVVIGSELCQHDMDASPLFARHEIPLLGTTFFVTEPARRSAILKAAKEFALTRSKKPQVVEGLIASGDKFFASASALDELKSRLPKVQCVEMEGAAVAQVCHEYGIPFSILRVISDSADEASPTDFPEFVRTVASQYSHGIIKNWIQASR